VSSRELNDAINRVVEGEEEAVSGLDEGIRIDTPKDPEVNPEVYRDVERLLFRGFLTLVGEINGVPFVFKSMNHHEFDNLQWITGGLLGRDRRSHDRYYSAFLSHGVFMIDGQNILPERGKWIPKLEETFGGLPSSARTKLIRYLSDVNRKASNAVSLTEAYQVEASSRFRWAQLRGLDLMSATCTGVQGTEALGMNYGQLVWRALNSYEDTRDKAEREWDFAKFIGGCFVGGKEIRKVHSQDTERRKKEREDRLERRDKVLRQVLTGEDPEDEKKNRTVKIVARTVEELASQLERDLRGEKDWHDEVVTREEARIRATIQERQQKIHQVSKDREQDPTRSATTEMAGLSRDEVQQRILRRRQLEAQEVAGKMVYPELMDPRMEAFLQKYMESDDTYQSSPGVKSNVGTTDRDTSDVHPQPPNRPRATPFRR
jgi:hypothetical protein